MLLIPKLDSQQVIIILFMRLWSEVDYHNIGKGCRQQKILKIVVKWFPCLSGGHARKWSDYIEYVVDWENDGYNLKALR